MKLINHLWILLFKVRYNTKLSCRFKSCIINFYDYYNTEWHFNSYRITKISLYNMPKKMIVEIHSLSPGMIIGKSGKCIDRLKAHLQKSFSKPIEIKLEETNPFK